MRIDAIDIKERILDKIETKRTGSTFEECEEVRDPPPRARSRRAKRESFKVFGPDERRAIPARPRHVQ